MIYLVSLFGASNATPAKILVGFVVLIGLLTAALIIFSFKDQKSYDNESLPSIPGFEDDEIFDEEEEFDEEDSVFALDDTFTEDEDEVGDSNAEEIFRAAAQSYSKQQEPTKSRFFSRKK